MKWPLLKQQIASIILCSSMVALTGCGENLDGPKRLNESFGQQQLVEEGDIYRAEIEPITGMAAENVHGSAKIQVHEGQISIEMSVDGASVSITQQIHTGATCPTMKDDTDSDGSIDLSEVTVASGENLISLDNDLADEGSDIQFPTPDSAGSYKYSQKASLATLLEGLMLQEQQLKLEDRVVVIFGSANGTLRPLACGMLDKEGAGPAGTPSGSSTNGHHGGGKGGGGGSHHESDEDMSGLDSSSSTKIDG